MRPPEEPSDYIGPRHVNARALFQRLGSWFTCGLLTAVHHLLRHLLICVSIKVCATISKWYFVVDGCFSGVASTIDLFPQQATIKRQTKAPFSQQMTVLSKRNSPTKETHFLRTQNGGRYAAAFIADRKSVQRYRVQVVKIASGPFYMFPMSK